MPHALIVDEERRSREALADIVRGEGFTTATAASAEGARAALAQELPDLALVDLKLPDGSGLDLVREIQGSGTTQVVVITALSSVDMAVRAMREGVLDYLTKPLDQNALRRLVADLKRWLETREDVLELREELRRSGRFGVLVGNSPAMQRVYDLIARVAPTSATVLITGSTGTGKELVARAIHDLSRRAQGPFVPVNCGAIQPTLIESELFGHEPGSFTGAQRRRRGLFEQAQGGTLFLDEITEMPADLQVKLLRVLETQQIVRVGGEKNIEVDVRLVAATNRDPEEAVEEEKLREDLLYRLCVFPIHVPPLRDRVEDVELLANYFIETLGIQGEPPRRLSPAALQRLREHSWPGNVRELRNVVERALIVSDAEVGPEDILIQESSDRPAPTRNAKDVRIPIGSSIADAERSLILATLEQCGGVKKRAAELLGISLKTLYSRLREYRQE